jgi:hypothetical protein
MNGTITSDLDSLDSSSRSESRMRINSNPNLKTLLENSLDLDNNSNVEIEELIKYPGTVFSSFLNIANTILGSGLLAMVISTYSFLSNYNFFLSSLLQYQMSV